MNQLKLLNFYKLLSYIATKLVGAFIPLIVIEATGKIYMGALALILMYFVRMSCNFLFIKAYQKYPQVILLFRLFTVIAYSVCIILIDMNSVALMWVGVVGCIIFFGMDDSFRAIPSETLFNYASQDSEGGKSPLGFSRLMEQVGVLVALIVGGVMLDFNKTLIIIISVIIYSISVIPLFIYFIKSRKQKTFNKDAVSNAQLKYEKNPELNKNAKQYSKKILWSYAFTYFVFCFQDVLGNALNIHIFLKSGGSFGSAGYLNAVYNALYGIGCFVFSSIDSKKETTPLIMASCIGCSGFILSIILTSSVVWWYIAMAFCGLFYGFICTYVLARMLPKCRIMGVSNNALFYREQASNTSVMVCMCFGLVGSMIPVLGAVVCAIGISSAIMPINEERTRKTLIKYLQNHERVMSVEKKSKKSVLPKQEIYEQNPIIDATGASSKSEKKKSVKSKTHKKV